MTATASQFTDTTPPETSRPRRRRHRFRVVLVALALGLVVLVLAHRPLLVGYAYLFRAHDPAPSDAIVVLLGQWSIRPVAAAELYHRGLAPVVLIGTTEPVPYPDLSESALSHRALRRAGVPAKAIHVLPGVVGSTQDEAQRVRAYAEAHGLRRVTVVTTAYHTARAQWIFRRVLDDLDVEIHAAAARDPRFGEEDWYRSDSGRASYLSEAPKWLYYQLVY